MERSKLLLNAATPLELIAKVIKLAAKWQMDSILIIVLNALAQIPTTRAQLHRMLEGHEEAGFILTSLLEQLTGESPRLGLDRSLTTWNGSLSADLEVLYKQRDRTGDFTVFIKKNPFKVHKAVLAARWDYFQAMISVGLKEAQLSTLTLPHESEDGGLSESALTGLIYYFYTNSLSLIQTSSDKENILKVAGLYCLAPLDNDDDDNPADETYKSFPHYALLEYCSK